MDIFSSLNIGVAGLQAQGDALSDISQNVSNADTVGYKEGLTTFSDLISDTSANNYSVNGNSAPDTGYSPSGAVATDNQLVDVQGNITPTSSPTDLAISGPGFFAVSPTVTDSAGNVEYTRAGSFTADANGNYANAAGQYLLAFPIDVQGNLPAGITGTTLSDSVLAALQPVNIQKVISIPVPTTTASIQANLNASTPVYPGASDTITMDANDTSNSGIAANSIIVPTSTDSIVQDDTFTISTGLNPTGITYTYGGIAVSRSAADPAVDGSSELGLQQPVDLTPQSGAGTTAGFTFNPSAPTSMTINLGTNTPASVGVTQTGQVINLSGTGSAGGINVNNISSLDGDYYVTGIGANSITVTIPSNITPPSAIALGAGDALDVTSVGANATADINFATLPTGIATGDVINLSGSTTVNGVTFNGAYTVTGISGNKVQFTTTDTSTATGSAAGTGTSVFDDTGNLADTNTATVTSRLFSGDILDANTATQPLITTPSDFTSAALSFTITTPGTGTSTFTYTSSATPLATSGQFNTLDGLATAINDVSGLSARVVNNQLYVAAVNGNDPITFANGSLTGSNTSPPLCGIDWVGELGLANVAAAPAGTERFSTMQGLADEVNNSTTLTATVNNPLSASTVKINADDPLDTITFTDGAGNTGSLLGELGLAPSLNGGAFVAQTAGPFGPAYDAAIPATNMASGAITPDFTIPITVVDSNGTNENLTAGFIKTGTNTWDVEVYANPASEVTATPAGQIATGTVTFNPDGTLASISPSLTQITATWTDGAAASSIAVNWGTAGAIGIGMANGLSQFTSDSNLADVEQNGIPANSVSTVSISSSGVISASYSNGNSRNLYQIPLAEFTNPEGLSVLPDDAYAQSAGSGTLSFLEPGAGTGATIQSNALESSNVDLATQLTNMIIAQNAYQANTKLISASSEMMQTATQMDQSISV